MPAARSSQHHQESWLRRGQPHPDPTPAEGGIEECCLSALRGEPRVLDLLRARLLEWVVSASQWCGTAVIREAHFLLLVAGYVGHVSEGVAPGWRHVDISVALGPHPVVADCERTPGGSSGRSNR